MRKLIIILFLSSVCLGDIVTSHQKPVSDSVLDLGADTLFWRYIYGDAFTDGTAFWRESRLYGFTNISADVLTDGVFTVTGGTITVGLWNGSPIDISDYTNLTVSGELTLINDLLGLPDVFLYNNADDTTTGTLTAAGFTTTGTITAGDLSITDITAVDIVATGSYTGGSSTFGDGGVTDYTEFDGVGAMTMHGDARVARHMVIGAGSWKRGATQPTETYENLFPTLSFQDAQDDVVHYATHVPYRWDNTTDMTVEVHWQHETADAGKVKWHLSYIGLMLGEDPAGGGTAITQLSAGTHDSDKLIVTTFTTKMLAANLARMDDLGLMLWREGTDVGDDTLAEDAELIAIHIHYTMNQLGELFEVFFLLLETGDKLLLETGDKLILDGI